MSNLFSCVVVLRFDCPMCGHKSEQRGALSTDQDTPEAIRKAVEATVPHCQHCRAPVAPATELDIEVLEKTAKHLVNDHPTDI